MSRPTQWEIIPNSLSPCNCWIQRAAMASNRLLSSISGGQVGVCITKLPQRVTVIETGNSVTYCSIVDNPIYECRKLCVFPGKLVTSLFRRGALPHRPKIVAHNGKSFLRETIMMPFSPTRNCDMTFCDDCLQAFFAFR